jgi:hypothetical protein
LAPAGFGGADLADAGWLKTMVPLAGGSGSFDAGDGAFRFPVWNIIVRPATSSAAGVGLGGSEGGSFSAPGVGFGLGAPVGFTAVGAANIIVVCAFGGFAGGGVAGAAPGRITLKVFWHLPHRMVSPCGPIRAESTRYRAWHFSQRTSIDASPAGSRGVSYRIRPLSCKAPPMRALHPKS